MKTEIFDKGNSVVCDVCNEDYTDSKECGGVLFGSKAYCPKCTPALLASAKSYGEEHYIKARCPSHVPFADWVRDVLRGGEPAIIKIHTAETFDEIAELMRPKR